MFSNKNEGPSLRLQDFQRKGPLKTPHPEDRLDLPWQCKASQFRRLSEVLFGPTGLAVLQTLYESIWRSEGDELKSGGWLGDSERFSSRGVIVGGGVTGAAMLYQLAKRGVKCVLFEKAGISDGRGQFPQ